MLFADTLCVIGRQVTYTFVMAANFMRIILGSSIVLGLLSNPVILSAQEPLEFTGRSNRQQTASTSEKAFYKQMLEAMKSLGHGTSADSTKKALLRLNELLKEHPDYSDGYLLRATTILQLPTSKDYQQVVDDINRSIQLRSTRQSKSAYKSIAPHLSMRAKAEKEMGKYQIAIEDLERAIRLSPTVPNDVMNLSGTKAEVVEKSDLWTNSDFDDFITKFPNDHRAYYFRGFFYSFFTTFDEKYYSRAIADYEKAITLESTDALPHFLLADLLAKASFWTKRVWTDLSGDSSKQFHRQAIPELDKVISLDTTFREAYVSRANAYYSTQQFELAITDYDKIIELQPDNASAYNDRGLASFNLGRYYDAIHHFDRAIEIKESSPNNYQYLELSYESRADAYMKVNNYSHAIDDFGGAIRANLGYMVILMNLAQIKATYPECKQLSDVTLSKKLWEQFGSNLQYRDFANLLAKNRGKNFSSTILPDLYVKRGDAYLCNYEFRNAIREYHRALDGFPDDSHVIGRWRLISTSTTSQHFLDMKNVELRSGQAQFWCKEAFAGTQPNGKASSLTHWTVFCSSRQIKLSELIDYDSDGNVLNSWSGAHWNKIVPETFGEVLYKGWCASRK